MTALSLGILGACGATPRTAKPADARTANAQAKVTPPPLSPAARARLAAIRNRLEPLAHELIGFWKRHGPDQAEGGFFGTLDREGHAVEPFDKGVIQQARHLWTLSTWYERRERTKEVRALADAQFDFLTKHFRDPEDGEFFFKVNRAGDPVDRKKPLYAQSFAIYALSEYARIFESADAKELSLACFHSIERRAHDAQYGGYDQTHDPFYFSAGTEKETNTHIHLLESTTALYRLTHDQEQRARLVELTELTAHKIVQPAGYARQEFKRDFTPFGATQESYGHDIETSWLLLDALDALGMQANQELTQIAYRLGEHAADFGFDAVHGGFFEAGEPGGPASKREKIWWIQAEALPGLYRLYALGRNPRDLDRLESVLSFIEQHQRDREFGEWYWGIAEDGSVGPHGSNKGEEWKASYHDIRALVLTSDWISEALKAP